MILPKNLFVGGLHLLMEIRKFDVTLKNWIIMNGLIKILYKTLTGEYATRWARENELSRLKGVKPLDTERFGLVYPEPDEEWPVGENKEIHTSTFGMDSDLIDPLQMSERVDSKKDPYFLSEDNVNPHNLLFSMDTPRESLFHWTTDRVSQSETEPKSKWKILGAEPVEGSAQPSLDVDNGREEPVVEKQTRTLMTPIGSLWNVSDRYPIFHGGNGELDLGNEVAPPAKQGIEQLYDKSRSNLSEEKYQELDKTVKSLRAYPKINHLFSMIEAAGPVPIIIDDSVKNPSYFTENGGYIKIPSRLSSFEKSAVLEEVIHRAQHLLYGTEAMQDPANRRVIEGEAKMFWDYFANHEAKGGLKMSRNKNYATELGRAINNGGIEDLDFFYRWVEEMDPEKVHGDTLSTNRKFDPKLLKYYHWKNKKEYF